MLRPARCGARRSKSLPQCSKGRRASSRSCRMGCVSRAALVRVDPGTGGVRVERFVIAYDIGRAVNPMLVEGQLVGAAAQGIGGALYEEFVYDENGQALATPFADYLMPTLAEMPSFETLVTEDFPSLLNPLGVKGAGEGG